MAIAIPFLKKAEAAVGSIKGPDIAEIRQFKTAKDIIRIIFDTVQILF